MKKKVLALVLAAAMASSMATSVSVLQRQLPQQ